MPTIQRTSASEPGISVGSSSGASTKPTRSGHRRSVVADSDEPPSRNDNDPPKNSVKNFHGTGISSAKNAMDAKVARVRAAHRPPGPSQAPVSDPTTNTQRKNAKKGAAKENRKGAAKKEALEPMIGGSTGDLSRSKNRTRRTDTGLPKGAKGSEDAGDLVGLSADSINLADSAVLPIGGIAKEDKLGLTTRGTGRRKVRARYVESVSNLVKRGLVAVADSLVSLADKMHRTFDQNQQQPIDRAIMRLMAQTESDAAHTAVSTMLRNGEEIETSSISLFRNLVRASSLSVNDIMVPRAHMQFLHANDSIERALERIHAAPHTRYPVREESSDEIIGMCHIRDLLHAVSSKPEAKPTPKATNVRGRAEGVNGFSLTKLCRKVLFVSPTSNLMEILREMQTKKQQMAIVVSSVGQPDGMITLEDLTEAIIGEIEDEHDRPRKQEVRRIRNLGSGSKQTFSVDPAMSIEDFSATIRPLSLDDDKLEVGTVGGYVVTLAGHIPKAGERFADAHNGIEFMITQADGRRILALTVEVVPD